MKVLIFGTGGVGGIYAFVLEKGGAQVTAVCRSNYEAVSKNGLSIHSKIFGTVRATPTAVRSTADAQGPFDYIVVAAKAFPGTSKHIAPAVSSGTAIVLCQNGIEIEQEYAGAYPENTIISGVVYLPTTQVEPGLIHMGPLQKLHLGTYPASAPQAAKDQVARFAAVFSKGGGECFVHDDVQQQRWIKLAVNIAWNPVCALTRLDDANYFRSSELAEPVIRDIMNEVRRVAAKAGYEISQDVIDEQLERPRQRLETGGKEPSMLTDVRHNRPIEVDAIVGNAVKIARRLGVETPRMDLLYALAKGLNYSIAPDERWKPIA